MYYHVLTVNSWFFGSIENITVQILLFYIFVSTRYTHLNLFALKHYKTGYEFSHKPNEMKQRKYKAAFT